MADLPRLGEKTRRQIVEVTAELLEEHADPMQAHSIAYYRCVTKVRTLTGVEDVGGWVRREILELVQATVDEVVRRRA